MSDEAAGGGPRGEAVRGEAPALDSVLDMALPVVIEFGRTTLTLQEVLALGNGSVVQLDRMVGEPIDLLVGERKLAEGEVVVVGEHFGIRVTRVVAEPGQPPA